MTQRMNSWDCDNPKCSCYKDSTPESYPNSRKCLMCNQPHRWFWLTKYNVYAGGVFHEVWAESASDALDWYFERHSAPTFTYVKEAP